MPVEPPQQSARERWAGRLADGLSSGPVVGFILALVLFGLGVLALTNVSYMGQTNRAVTEFAFRTYGTRIAVEQLKILALYLAFGLAGGILSSLLCHLRDRLRHHQIQSRLWKVGRHLLILLGLHLYFLARSMIVYPQMYADQFFDKGGFRRGLQLFLTDSVPPLLLDLLVITAVLVFVLGPLVWRLARDRPWKRSTTERGLESRARLARLLPAGLVLGMLGATVAATVLASGPGTATDNRGPNILIIAVDSLRADRVDGQRYRSATPVIRRLARRGVRFQRAYSTLARTFPAWMNLLTGREPYEHGIRHMFPTWEDRARIGPTLATHLAAKGYRTAVVSDYAGEIFGRVNVGFHHTDVSAFSFYEIIRQRMLKAHWQLLPYLLSDWGRRVAPPLAGIPENSDPFILAERANQMITRVADHRAFMAVIFFSTPHFPYAAPYPYYKRYTKPSYDGPYRYHKQRLFKAGKGDHDHVRRLFDGAVRATDAAISRILDHLRRLEIDKKTIVVITADHGENLYEGALGMGHGDHLLGEHGTRVPLIVYDPRRPNAGRRVGSIVRDIDLAPTLAAMVGQPMRGVSGKDLRPLMRGAKPADPDRAAMMETGLWFTDDEPAPHPRTRLPYPPVLQGLVTVDADRGSDIVLSKQYQRLVLAAKHRAIRTLKWKLVYAPHPGGVRYLLFDAERDPDNLRDIAAKHPKVVERLAARLRRWMLREPGSVEAAGYVLPPPLKRSRSSKDEPAGGKARAKGQDGKPATKGPPREASPRPTPGPKPATKEPG